jgi:hypothetical protein
MRRAFPNPAMDANAKQLELFKRELWKDQRKLATIERDGRKLLVKPFATELEGQTELHVIDWLRDHTRNARLPVVVGRDVDHVELEYIRGVRLFNLFVELDRLPPDLIDGGEALKRRLLETADRNQRAIQKGLREVPHLTHWRPYPAGSKIRAIIEILAPPLQIKWDDERLAAELEHFDDRWVASASVPFRDATTKNMVLAAPELWLGNFDGEEARRDYLVGSLRVGTHESWLNSPVIDFDFASCGEISTPEDDLISLRFHERTWRTPPADADELVWGDIAPNAERAALTFITRYYRFGGRKAAYRLLHPWGHRVRFRHDGDVFYFERLPEITARLYPSVEMEYPVLMGVTRAIARSLEAGRPAIDQFIAAGLGEKRSYFVDMFLDEISEDPVPEVDMHQPDTAPRATTDRSSL